LLSVLVIYGLCCGLLLHPVRQVAEVLVETWAEINTALAASETPSLSWRQVFIPALEGTRGATESRGWPALFTAAQPNVNEMETELDSMVKVF
jgi:hypothetical protein